jgi:hypothetical protein
MHILDRKWPDLAAGYQAMQSFQAKMTAEFGRAVQVGHKLRFRKDLSEWQKKRRVFFALAAIALLAILALCGSAYYLRDLSCVIVYWAVLVVIILVTLAVAGRQYIREMVNGRPVAQSGEGPVDLEGRWWECLAPEEPTVAKPGEPAGRDFLAQLARSLPDTYQAVCNSLAPGQPAPDSEVLVLGPWGIWLFEVRPWSGTILKQDGIWKQVQTHRFKSGEKRNEENSYDPGPDDRWLQEKQEIIKTLENHFPEQLWTRDLVQGGVVFSHPKASIDKKRIQGNTAAYGRARAWVKRVHHTPAIEGFPLEMQLEILDALNGGSALQNVQATIPVSSKDLAGRLYQDAVIELRDWVVKVV